MSVHVCVCICVCICVCLCVFVCLCVVSIVCLCMPMFVHGDRQDRDRDSITRKPRINCAVFGPLTHNLLPVPPKCRDYRSVPSFVAQVTSYHLIFPRIVTKCLSESNLSQRPKSTCKTYDPDYLEFLRPIQP